jgi:hypothetical protein
MGGLTGGFRTLAKYGGYHCTGRYYTLLKSFNNAACFYGTLTCFLNKNDVIFPAQLLTVHKI